MRKNTHIVRSTLSFFLVTLLLFGTIQPAFSFEVETTDKKNKLADNIFLTENIKSRDSSDKDMRNKDSFVLDNKTYHQFSEKTKNVNTEADIDLSKTESCEYLIIVYPDFYKAIMPLALWNHKRGLKTKVVSVDTFQVSDIKEIITETYKEGSLKYVLLVGDAKYIPVYYWDHYRVTFYKTFPYYVSDYYYACLEEDQEGLVDPYPDVAVGRVSANTANDVENQVKKILAYQKNPPCDEWLTTVLMNAYDGGTERRFESKSDHIIASFFDHPQYTVYRSYHEDLEGRNAYVTDKIESGTHLVGYNGDSNTFGMIWSRGTAGTVGWVNEPDVAQLSNDEYTPVFLTTAGRMNMIAADEECFGEALMNKYPGGAVAALAGVEYMYEFTPFPFWEDANTCYTNEVYNQLFNRSTNCLGDSCMKAAEKTINHYDQYGQAIALGYILLGDPSMPIWTDVPESIKVSLSENDIQAGKTQSFILTLTAQDDTPIENAKICVTKENELYNVYTTDENGEVAIEVFVLSEGMLSIVASKHNYLPAELELTVESPVVVNQNTSKEYASIQTALDEASPGDTISTSGGCFQEDIVITKPITLQGGGVGKTLLKTKALSKAILCIENTQQVTFSGFSIHNGITGVRIDDASDIIIKNCLVSNCHWGIHMQEGSSQVTVVNNTIQDNGILSSNNYHPSSCGILMQNAKHNRIYLNTIRRNYEGIRLDELCGKNHIYQNDFLINKIHNAIDNGENLWDNDSVDGGNYWDDYSGSDTDGDGFGEEPYDIPPNNRRDFFPRIHSIQPEVFIRGPNTGQKGDTLVFQADITGGSAPFNYVWRFHDESTSNDPDPEKTYDSSGVFSVSLIVSDNHGFTARSETIVSISNDPVLTCDVATPNSPMVGIEFADVAQLSVSVSGGYAPYQYFWEYGDGSNSTQRSPRHIYTQAGVFDASVTVTDLRGNQCTVPFKVTARHLFIPEQNKYFYTLVDALSKYGLQDDQTLMISRGVHFVDEPAIVWGDLGRGGDNNIEISKFLYRAKIIGEDKEHTIITNSDDFVGDRLCAMTTGIQNVSINNLTFHVRNGCTIGLSIIGWHNTIQNNIFTTDIPFPSHPEPPTIGIENYGYQYQTIAENDISGFTYGIRRRHPKGEPIGYDDNQLITHNTIYNNSIGMYYSRAYGGTITENRFVDNDIGMKSYKTNIQTISKNVFQNHSSYAIELDRCIGSTIYQNNFYESGIDHGKDTDQNTWYSNDEDAGNYWDDYSGSDTEGDGIGDTPYVISGSNFSSDRYPLMEAWEATDPEPFFTYKRTDLTVYFNASKSYDPDGFLVEYLWDFGDQSQGSGITVDHSYAWYGTYTVSLQVKDNDDTVATYSWKVRLPPPRKNEIYHEDFNGGIIDKENWKTTGAPWITKQPTEFSELPRKENADYNRVAEIKNTLSSRYRCTLEQQTPLDLRSYETVNISLDIWIDKTCALTMLSWEGAVMYFFDGAEWVAARVYWNFGASTPYVGRWYTDQFEIPADFYTSSFKILFWVQSRSHQQNIMIDNILIRGVPKTGENNHPKAAFSFTPQRPQINEQVQFSDESSDTDGTIQQWRWEFGDTNISYDQHPSYTYTTHGTYIVNLTVIDDDKAVSQKDSQPLTVPSGDPDNIRPLSRLRGPAQVYVDQLVEVNGSYSGDTDGRIVLYEWDWQSDGNYDEFSTTSAIADHIYSKAGTYRITLRVTDDDGLTDIDSIDVSVVALPEPTVLFFDDFESGSFDNWIQNDPDAWQITTATVKDVPGKPASNLVASCKKQAPKSSIIYELTMNTTVDLSFYYQATVEFWRFVDDRVLSEYLIVYGGNDGRWEKLFHWTWNAGDDDTWHYEKLILPPEYLSDGFKLKFVACQQISGSGAVVEIDDVRISVVPHLDS